MICALLMVCLSWTAVAWSAEEGEAIERTVKEAAMAAATFSETRDKQAVLKLYTKDYVGIQDGETETRDSIEKWLSDYESELNKGSTLRFISAVSNLHVRMPGPTAWATYDYVFQAIRKGELEAQDSGQCTTLLRKEGSTWLIQHEHCSKTSNWVGEVKVSEKASGALPFSLLEQVIRNQRGEFGRLHHPFAGQEQLAIGKEVRRGVGLEGVALLNLAAAAWDMHLGLADFHVGKLGGGLFQDRVVGLAGLTGR